MQRVPHGSNTVLRGKSGDEDIEQRCRELCKGNDYPTTIHAINSFVIKLSKLTPATKVKPPERLRWHGVSGAGRRPCERGRGAAGSQQREGAPRASAVASSPARRSSLQRWCPRCPSTGHNARSLHRSLPQVWRGFKDVRLPSGFWKKNEAGVRGGVEFAFLSTSTSRAVA